jgi:hypothetical protein
MNEARSPDEQTPSNGHPLGPLICRQPLSRQVLGRLFALVLFVLSAGVLVTAARLPPNPAGAGTHERLGLAPCGFYSLTGIPCPTCGMTTAFAYAVRGQLFQAFEAQAMGLLLALATAAAAGLSLIVAVTGRTWTVNWYRIDAGRVLILVGVLLILAWGLKIAWVLAERSLPADAGSLG